MVFQDNVEKMMNKTLLDNGVIKSSVVRWYKLFYRSMFETHTPVQDDVDDVSFSHYIVTLNQAVVSSMLMRQKI